MFVRRKVIYVAVTLSAQFSLENRKSFHMHPAAKFNEDDQLLTRLIGVS